MKGDDPLAATNMAINFNNLSVMELRAKNYDAALAAAKQAFGYVELELLHQMNSSSCAQLKQNLPFLEKLQVLLVSYFNYGMC